MNKTFSLYLDLVRFAAACLVVLFHANQRWLTESIVPASNYGHSAVIVFFVLSGFVISYVTQTRENTLPEYSASRIARIYSVTLPAVLLTPLLDYVGRRIYDVPYPGAPSDWPLIRLGASATFTNELWFVSIASFSNAPYWSLCYEVWYYIVFGVWFFARGQARRWWLGAAMLIMGPKMLLLAPIWCMGVLLHRWRPLDSRRESVGWALLSGSTVAIVAFHSSNVVELCADWLHSVVGPYWYRELAYSKFFISDNLLGALVTLHFAGMRTVAHRFRPLLDPAGTLIRGLAAYTFTLYVLHVPLILFWAAVLRGDRSRPWYLLETIALVGVSVFAVGYVTENKRHALRRWLLSVLSRPLQLRWTRRSVL